MTLQHYSADELGDEQTFTKLNRLYDTAVWHKSYFIITCRNGVFDGTKARMFIAPRDSLLGLPQPHLLMNIYLAPLSDSQLHTYVVNFSRTNNLQYPGWSASRYITALAHLFCNALVMRNPLLLFLALSTIPCIADRAQEFECQQHHAYSKRPPQFPLRSKPCRPRPFCSLVTHPSTPNTSTSPASLCNHSTSSALPSSLCPLLRALSLS